jgi:adenosylcobinamide kinase / adenosylcobinamide-phosphate guanylyltransferase
MTTPGMGRWIMADQPRLTLVLGGARSGKSTFAERLASAAAARAASPPPSPVTPSPDGPRGDSLAPTAASAAAVATGDESVRTAGAVVDAAGAVPPPSGTGRVVPPGSGDAFGGPVTPSGAGRVVYLATSQPYDDEMRQRVARHQADRPQNWTTVECPLEVPAAIRDHAATTDVFLLDCVTFWVTNLLFASDIGVEQMPEGLGDFTKEFIAPEAERAAAQRVARSLDDLEAALRETGAALIAVSNEVGLGLVPEYPLSRLFRDELGRANARLAAVADPVYFLVAGLPLEVKSLSRSPFAPEEPAP